MNNRYHQNTSSNTPGDNQGRWYELLSPTQVLTGQLTEDRSEDDQLFMDDTTEEVPIRRSLKPLEEEEEILSQKLSQLSTVPRSEEDVATNNEDLEANIPSYLSKESKSFQQLINQISSTHDIIEEIRSLAILNYRLLWIDLQKSLWNTYLQSGTGQLKSNQTDHKLGPFLWPPEVRSMTQKSVNNNDHTACLTYVTQHLAELDKKKTHYQMELTMKNKPSFHDMRKIELFVQQGFDATRLEIEKEIALVQYNYKDRILELDYLQYHPTPHQKQIAQQLCYAKYQEELTKEEFQLLKQRMTIHTSASSSSLELAPEPLFNTIENQDVREKLHYQYIHVAQQAREEMFELYLSSAEAQMNRYHQQFNLKVKQFWSEQRTLPYTEKLSDSMIHLIEQRYKNVSEKVKCVYKYKTEFIRLKSNHQQE